MKPALIIAFVCILTFPSLAFSRVGETIEQCEARYGAHLKATDGDGGMITESRLYMKNGFNVIVGFSKGICHLCIYTKMDGTALNDVEEKSLLQAEAGTSSWQLLRDFSMDTKWQRIDGEVLAQYESVNKRMAFTSKAYLGALNTAKDAKDKKAMDGF